METTLTLAILEPNYGANGIFLMYSFFLSSWVTDAINLRDGAQVSETKSQNLSKIKKKFGAISSKFNWQKLPVNFFFQKSIHSHTQKL